MEKKLMEAMEKVRQSGVCNMIDGSCVKIELEKNHGFTVDNYKEVFSDFCDYKKNEG